MSEHFQNDDEQELKKEEQLSADSAENAPSAAEARPTEAPDRGDGYRYRWDYASQSSYEREEEKKRRKRGIGVYVVAMASVFAVCILLLVGVILLSGAMSPGSPALNGGNHSIGAVAEAVKPSTVLIESAVDTGVSYGTGFFVTENGYIVTNYHVVENSRGITVTLYSGKQLQATLKGFYAPDDLAVLKIEGKGYPVLRRGDSDALRVGDTAIAIGNPSGAEGGWSTTHGIVSALGRRVAVSAGDFSGVMKMIQTDAPVNPGNSGGPLCNANGEIVGIVTQKLTNYESIGFAIPINEAMHTIDAIMKNKQDSFESSVTLKRPMIGVTVQNITKGSTYSVGDKTYVAAGDGVFVNGVTLGGPADGILLPGDIIFEFDGTAVRGLSELQNLLYRHSAGDTVSVKVYRGAEIKTLKITLK